MQIIKTVYNENLRTPDGYTVTCGEKRKNFNKGEEENAGKWIRSAWDSEIFPSPAYVYYNIGWDNDHVLYCKYEVRAESEEIDAGF